MRKLGKLHKKYTIYKKLTVVPVREMQKIRSIFNCVIFTMNCPIIHPQLLWLFWPHLFRSPIYAWDSWYFATPANQVGTFINHNLVCLGWISIYIYKRWVKQAKYPNTSRREGGWLFPGSQHFQGIWSLQSGHDMKTDPFIWFSLCAWIL